MGSFRVIQAVPAVISALVEMCDLAQGAPNLYYNSLLFIVSLGQKTGTLTPIVSYSVPQWVGSTLPQVDLGKDKSTPSSISSNVQTTTSTTNPYNGSIITITTSAPTPSPANNTSNTGAIVSTAQRPHLQQPYNEGERRKLLHGISLATQQEVDVESSSIVQHQDAGQSFSQEEGGELKDVPPAYESIRQ
ncbi:hypothetical protein EDB19DRAFT_1832700 [Suillus lakei]|nr:hypothetical protein EDB19DRAFT_1832700 [Suillus lakei]